MLTTSLDETCIRYLSVISVEDGENIVSVPYRGMMVDPDLIAGFITAVVIFAKTPIRTIRKAAYDILIEVGETKLVLLVCDPVPDETPYRRNMKQVLNFAEIAGLAPNRDYSPNEVFRGLKPEYPPWLQLVAFHLILSTYGFGWIGLLDIDPSKIVQSLLSSTSLALDDADFQDQVLPHLCSQIDQGGVTIGLDVQRMAEYGDLAQRIDDVLAQRENEIKQIKLLTNGNEVDLGPLWLTAYGNQILNALDLGAKCSLDEFSDLHAKFKEIGFNLRTTEKPVRSTKPKVSPKMREYILRRLNSLHIRNLNPNSPILSSLLREIMKSNVSSQEGNDVAYI